MYSDIGLYTCTCMCTKYIERREICPKDAVIASEVVSYSYSVEW